MPNQAAMGMTIHNVDKNVQSFSHNDSQVLKRLAARVAEIAALDEQQEKKKLWFANNALKPIRPVVFCDPENGWNEIILEEDCQCKNNLARNIEYTLRKEIFWGERMGDDKVIEAVFDLPHVYDDSGWGLDTNKIGDEYGHAYTWHPPLKEYETDLAKMHLPIISIDWEASKRIFTLVQETIGQYLQVRLKTAWWWSFGLTREMIFLRGMERFFFDIYDNPKELHKTMSILRDGYIKKIEYLEANGLLSLNNGNTYVGSGGFGFSDELPKSDFIGSVRLKDMWGFAESQETLSMSPAMFEEFVFQYQLPILEKFGLNCYGCCEPIDNRWEVVKKTPGLRRVSISAWANLLKSADLLENKYIFSYKPSPSDLAVGQIDKTEIRKKLCYILDATKGCCIELIMKDNNTICNNPNHVIDWCRIAKEEAMRL